MVAAYSMGALFDSRIGHRAAHVDSVRTLKVFENLYRASRRRPCDTATMYARRRRALFDSGYGQCTTPHCSFVRRRDAHPPMPC
ncbi:hypothetical protein LshimejAT787_0800750 [Lyophyllum shimeji]|uniref:Uncharacterized protein n=1 Tax=Lyophyllum shimeji TaxID=47721 RepID=A0A9P3PRE3_LYOSH|nr:hypothetical protein LshimejAT787_0800750 [Lyophyllum shimeji]